MTASASGFDPAKLPAALRPGAAIVDQAPAPGALADAAKFEEGQLSGPFGPKFVGYGPMPALSIRERFGATLLIAAGLAGLSGLIMLARAAF